MIREICPVCKKQLVSLYYMGHKGNFSVKDRRYCYNCDIIYKFEVILKEDEGKGIRKFVLKAEELKK